MLRQRELQTNVIPANQGFIQDFPLRGGYRGQGGVCSNCRVAFFRDLRKGYRFR